MMKAVTERVKSGGRVVEEILECGHKLDVRQLKEGKIARRCPECPGDSDPRKTAKRKLQEQKVRSLAEDLATDDSLLVQVTV